MLPAIPLTIGDKLGDRIVELMLTGHQYSANDELIIALESDGKKLAKVAQGEGYVVLAATAALSGDYGQMRSRFQIAMNQNISSIQIMNYATTLAYVGMFSESRKLIEKYGSSCKKLSLAITRAGLALSYHCASELIDKLETLKLEPSEDEKVTFDNFKVIAQLMDKALLTDSDTTALADLAGEVMRKHRVSTRFIPHIDIQEGDDGLPSFCNTFKVPVSFEEASEMNMELAELFATLETRTSFNRHFIRFVGNYEHNA